MDYNVRTVSLPQVDTTDQTFRITSDTDFSALVPSIKSIGLLHPPLLLQRGQAYVVVFGFRRIAACQAMGINSIPARIDHDQLPWIEYARLAIADNAFQRQLNVVEQSRALALIRRFAEDSTDWHEIAASAGLPDSQTAIDRLLPIVDMPEALQMAIVSGSIALPIALSINQLKNDDALVLSDLFQRINAGLNIQRELLELIVELSFIEEISIVRLLEQMDVATILANEDTPLPQIVQHLRRVFKHKRYPELTKAEEAFHQAFKAIKGGSTIQLQPPPFFEGKTFRLTLSINSRQQLKSSLIDIEKIANHPHLLPE
jgi:ParB family transcriptional regulator, chromosome partitioning protein